MSADYPSFSSAQWSAESHPKQSAIVKPDWSAFDLAVYSADESTDFTSINDS